MSGNCFTRAVGLALFTVLLLTGPGVAADENDDTAARELLTDCLKSSPARDCLFRVSGACQRDQPVSIPVAMVCAGQEARAWEHAVNEVLAEAIRRLSDRAEVVAALRRSQAAWSAWQSQECAFAEQLYAGGSYRLEIGANCRTHTFADRFAAIRAMAAGKPPY